MRTIATERALRVVVRLMLDGFQAPSCMNSDSSASSRFRHRQMASGRPAGRRRKCGLKQAIESVHRRADLLGARVDLRRRSRGQRRQRRHALGTNHVSDECVDCKPQRLHALNDTPDFIRFGGMDWQAPVSALHLANVVPYEIKRFQHEPRQSDVQRQRDQGQEDESVDAMNEEAAARHCLDRKSVV